MKGPKMSWRICAGAVLCLLVLPAVTLAAGEEGQEDVASVGQNHPLYEVFSAMGFDDARIVAVLQDPEIYFDEALNRIVADSEAAENGPEVVEIVEPQPIVQNNEVKLEEPEEEREELDLGLLEERQDDAAIEINVFDELLGLGFEASDIRRVLTRPGVSFDQALGRLLGEEPIEDEGEKEDIAAEVDREVEIIEPPPIVRNNEAKLEEEEREDMNIGGEEKGQEGAVSYEDMLDALLKMGFSEERSRKVLSEPRITLEEACKRLLNDDPVEEVENWIQGPPADDIKNWFQEEEEDVPAEKKGRPEEVKKEGLAQSKAFSAQPELVAELKDYGFTEDIILEVLQIPGIDLDKALDLLINYDVDQIRLMHNGPLPKRDQQEVDEGNVNVQREEKAEEEVEVKDRPNLLVEEAGRVEPEDQVDAAGQEKMDSVDENLPELVEAKSRLEASADELPAEPFAKEEDLPDDPFAKLVEMGFSEASVREILAVPGVWFETALITLMAHQQNAEAQDEETPGGEDEEGSFVSELAASGLDNAMIDKLGSNVLAHMATEDDASDDTAALTEEKNAAEETDKPVGVSPEDLPDDPVAKLVAMGFSESTVRKVLAERNIRFETALSTLLGQEPTEDGVQEEIDVNEGESIPTLGLESSYYGDASKVDVEESNTNTDARANFPSMEQSKIDLTPLKTPEDAKTDGLLFNSQISFLTPVEKSTVGNVPSDETPLFRATVKLFLDMGFDPDQVRIAVQDAGGDVDRAMEILTEPQVAESKIEAEESHSAPTGNSNDDHRAADLPFDPQYYRFGGVLSPLPKDFSTNPESYREAMEQLYREFHSVAHFRKSEPVPDPLWSRGEMPLSSFATHPQAVEAYVALRACNDLIRMRVVEPNRVSIDAIGGLNHQVDGVVMGGVILPLYKGSKEETLRDAIEKGPERELDIAFAGSQEESMNRGFLGYQTLYQLMEKARYFLQQTGGQSPVGIVLTTVRGSVAIIVETSMFGDEVYRVYDPNPDAITGKKPPLMFRSYSQQDIAFTLRDKFPFVNSGSLAEDLVQNSYEAAFVRYQPAPRPEPNLGELESFMSAFQNLGKPSANSKSSQAEQ